MEHYYLAEHAKSCSTKIIEWWGYSERSTCYSHDTVFYHRGNFYIFTYNRCLFRGYSDPEMMEELLKKILDAKKTKYQRTDRLNLRTELKKMIQEDRIMRRAEKEINYMYCDAAGKKYCIVTTLKYSDKLFSSIGLVREYDKTVKYLKEYNPDLIKQAEALYYENLIFDEVNDKTVFNTIDELIKKMKNGS